MIRSICRFAVAAFAAAVLISTVSTQSAHAAGCRAVSCFNEVSITYGHMAINAQYADWRVFWFYREFDLDDVPIATIRPGFTGQKKVISFREVPLKGEMTVLSHRNADLSVTVTVQMRLYQVFTKAYEWVLQSVGTPVSITIAPGGTGDVEAIAQKNWYDDYPDDWAYVKLRLRNEAVPVSN